MSTIKVDTIQKANGTSQIGIDKIGGVASAGTIAVIAEGGTNTTNLAQGLAKAFTTFNAESSNASYTSFNQSSLTDIAVGQHALNFTTNMGSGNYFCFGSAGDTGSTTGQRIIGVGDATAPTASTVTFDTIDIGGNLDDQDHHNFGVMGDLA